MERMRRDRPGVLMALVGNQTIPLVLDALLDAPPHKEFTKTELAEYAGVSSQSIRNHIDTLLEFDIIEPVPRTSRYRLCTDSQTVKRLLQLKSALDQAATSDGVVEATREDADERHLSPTFPRDPRPDEFNPVGNS